MTDAGFFRGTSAEQDNRFSDKHKKLLKQLKFNDVILQKVDLKNVNLAVMRPWINRRVTEMIGQEDEVLSEFIYNQLEESHSPDARMMQINITGFMNGKNAREFMAELWELLLSAMQSPNGIPPKLIEEKKQELLKKQEAEEQARGLMKLQLAREEAERLRLKQQLHRLEQDYHNSSSKDHDVRRSRSKSPKDNERDKSKESKRSEVKRLDSPDAVKNHITVTTTTSSSSRRGRSPATRRRESPPPHSSSGRNRSPRRHRSPAHRSRSPKQRRRQSRSRSPRKRSRSPRRLRSRSPKPRSRSPKKRSEHSRSPPSRSSKQRKHRSLKKSHRRRSSSPNDRDRHSHHRSSSHRSSKSRPEKRSQKSFKIDRRGRQSSSSSSSSSSSPSSSASKSD